MSAQQLSSLIFHLKPSVQIDKKNQSGSLGPFLQGALMEHIDKGYASEMHMLPFNPYSQHCYWENEQLVWRVSALTSEADSYILKPMRALDSIELLGIHTRFDVVASSFETLSHQELTSMVNNPGADKIRIRFITPTAFKSQGSYVIMPSVRLILQNLLMHYGQVYGNDKEGYEETVEYVDKHVRVLAYNLRTAQFGHIAGNDRSIPGFVGTMSLGLRGSEMTAGLSRMLLKFGEYAGVGIKTSMGMGGFQCQ